MCMPERTANLDVEQGATLRFREFKSLDYISTEWRILKVEDGHIRAIDESGEINNWDLMSVAHGIEDGGVELKA